MNRIDRGIKAAADAARFVTHSRYRIGAAIYLGNRLISLGWNKNKTHPVAKGFFKWKHAEMAALIGTSKYDLTRATIYVARITSKGEYKMSKPCEDCQDILRAAGLTKVVYTNRQGRIKKISL